jgi:hypothetical protein
MSGARPPFSYADKCEHCATCKRILRSDEPVWRKRVGIGRGMFGGRRTAIVPVCEQCIGDDPCVHSVGPCKNCGRTVHDTAWPFPRRFIYCCHHCELTHQSARLAAASRQRRADARGSSRSCVECGDHFEPRRTDSQYCSTACKQKAYRKRALRIANENHCAPFESGNAKRRRAMPEVARR